MDIYNNERKICSFSSENYGSMISSFFKLREMYSKGEIGLGKYCNSLLALETNGFFIPGNELREEVDLFRTNRRDLIKKMRS
jgi:hypothetical protein